MKRIVLLLLILSTGISCPAQQKITYNVLENAETHDYEIYIMDADGRNAKNITNSKSVDWVYTSFGEKLYFLSDRNECSRCFYLYEMDSEGKNVRKITNYKLADSWFGSRKNGTEFIVKPVLSSSGPSEGKNNTFYIIDLQGTIIEKVMIDLTYVNDPTFSPDGKKIVFRGSKKTSPRELGFTDALYVKTLGEDSIKKITSHPDETKNIQWTGYLAAAPRWRDDGKISFASKNNNNYDIYIVNPDGSELEAVTPWENNQVFHSWSPSGEMVFEASMNNQDGYELYKRTTNGKIIQLTNDTTEQYAPVFVETHLKKQ
ncbi:hypothetical protein HME9304_02025 [Flagellimonas maritima]|uniref:Dipeptidylpeptidase IV N-terminal domain-containing protein n=1 Tax=Flagellimonas maritima TaxID=1383885 RepID=A0A2Z4LUP7_9FLAO|nr:PD40 domain-containing protein [Allomuricauda aurantiaca]AWX45017.1 hypothetical protein HME9304_02025 [Allomuricauda aurantiaca]